jgi:predicted hydrocarbon binding protein
VTRLQEVEKLIDENLALITQYTKRAAELIGSVRQLEKERDRLMKKNKGIEIVRCKDCVKLNRYDCPMCYIENKTLQFAEVKPNFYCGKGSLSEEVRINENT